MIRPTMSHAVNKEQLHELMSKYASHLEDELAKTNERLKESEQVRTEYSFLIADLVRRADVKNDLYKNPTYQKASEQLNKFAIESQIKALEFILGRVESVTVSHVVKDHIVYRIKQLRKEQDND